MQSDEYKELKEDCRDLRNVIDEKYGSLLKDSYSKFSDIDKQLNNHIVHISADVTAIKTRLEGLEDWKKDFSCQLSSISDRISKDIKTLMSADVEDKTNAKINATNINWIDRIIWIFLGGIIGAIVLASVNHLLLK